MLNCNLPELLTLVLLIQDKSFSENKVDPDQLVSDEAMCSGYTLFSNLIWASSRKNLSFGGLKQHRRRPACASAQSDQRL